MARVASGPVAEVRADEGEWRAMGLPGVDRKMLYRDPLSGVRTYLMRLQPGAVLPPHRHKTPEQCLVVEGDLGWDGQRYRKGDFVVAAAEQEHTTITSENGALVLIVGG